MTKSDIITNTAEIPSLVDVHYSGTKQLMSQIPKVNFKDLPRIYAHIRLSSVSPNTHLCMHKAPYL